MGRGTGGTYAEAIKKPKTDAEKVRTQFSSSLHVAAVSTSFVRHSIWPYRHISIWRYSGSQQGNVEAPPFPKGPFLMACVVF